MTVPALSDTPEPAERRKKPRAPSLTKNVSQATRDSREIRLVDEAPDRSMAPSFLKEARFSCAVCGSRSVGKIHDSCDRRRASWLVKVDRRAKEPER